MKPVFRPSLSLMLAALVPSLLMIPTTTTSAQVVTVPVYVPGYSAEYWEDLAGSAIGSDSVATTYTIFCPDAADCNIAGPLPFTFAEGPSTFEYSGIIENTFTALISCQLASTTAATCTEYSSFGSKFTKGNTTGPTALSRTQTYTGDEVQWGGLTLTSPAPVAATATATGSDGVETGGINPTDTAWFFPAPTSGSSSTSWAVPRVRGPRGELVVVLVGIMCLMAAGLGVGV